MKRRRRRPRVDLNDAGVVIGASAAIVGIALISLAAALIVGGAALATGCVLLQGQR